jgi:putative addiction module component (TIGR02574 family)
MTLAAAKKMMFKLPPRQRIKFAEQLFESVPVLPGSVGLEELERRAEEVLSGKEKGIPWEEFERELKEMERSIRRARASEAAGPARRSPKRTVRRRV